MVSSLRPNSATTIIAMDAFPGQKLQPTQESPQPIVDRKKEVPSAREEIPREEVEKAIEKLNRLMGIIDKRMEFSIHEKSHRVMVKIIDRETGDVLNEIPPKRILDLLGSFREMAGLFLDKQL